MARIGNETKLILKLAKATMLKSHGHILMGAQEAPWNKGYQDCFRDYQQTTERIVSELESK